MSKRRPWRRLPVAMLGIGILCAHAAEIRVNNPTDLQNATRNLLPGDTLVAETGTYTMSYWDIRNLSGARTNWISIRPETNVLIRGTSTGSNVVEIRDCRYLRLIGFEILSTTATNAGIDGIKISGTSSSFITFEGLNIHNTSGNGISVFAGEAHHLTLRDSRIAYCTGSGLYWGYPGRNIVHDVLIARNHIHHCPSNSLSETHYGIQYKGWSYRARIVDNVLHDVGGTTRSGIIVYYGKTPLQGDIPEDVNIVRGNILWNCRNEGITVMSDAWIENNIVADAVIGINIQTYNDESFTGANYVENLLVRNNTAFRCNSACLSVGGWSSVTGGVTLAGNAAYQDSASGSAVTGSSGSGTVTGNVYYGTCSLSKGVVAGTGLSDFVNVQPSGAITNLDFYPSASSALLDRVPDSSLWAEVDFNGTSRPFNGAADAGAYERTGSANPGWSIEDDFKSTDPPPAPEILNFQMVSPDTYSLSWPHTVYWTHVDRSPSLTPPLWQSVTGPVYELSVPMAVDSNSPAAFFRLRLEP